MSDFWSKRRAAVQAEQEAETAQQVALDAEAEQARLAERSDEEILAELNVPPPEEMERTEEITAFLKEKLPERLRTRALRKLWRLNPVLANLDGLVDYGEDYTDASMVVENLTTAYQVGKGMLARFETDEGETADAPEPESDEIAAVDETPDEPPVQHYETLEQSHEIKALEPFDEEVAAEPTKSRRMRFHFNDTAC